MQKRSFVVFFVLILSMLLSMSMSSVGAQGGSWTVTVFNPDSKTFSTITPDGLTPGATLPSGSVTFTNVYGVRLSPSGTYAVFNATTSDQDPGGAYIANLASGSCCLKLQDPAQPNMTATYIGPFSPDETQIAASMLDLTMLGSGTTLPPAIIMVFDLASGSVVASTPVSAIQSEDTFAMAAAFGSWDQNGIRVIPTCWGCEGVWEGLYSIWNPLANTMSAPSEPFDIFRQALPATGELIKSTANNAYPLSGAPGAYFAASNIVEYYANSAQPAGQVIYFNTANPYVTNATWVYDGRAILVQLGGKPVSTADNPFFNEEPGEAYLLFRDGRQVPVQPALGYPLTGTPDGWITQRWDTLETNLIKVDDSGNTQIVSLGTGTRWEVAGRSFTLGASASPTPFPAVNPPTRTTCPGFVESRLWPNSFARVAPGPANNFRAEPATTSALLGSIPGEGFLAVLEGPVCAENMAWWRVQYNGQIGWTSEGQGSAFWLEPLSEVIW